MKIRNNKRLIIVMIVINLLIFSVVFPIQKTKADTINISPQAIPITVPVGIGAEILGGFLAGGLLAGLKDTFSGIGKNITDFIKNNIGVQQLEYDYINNSEWILADDKIPSLRVKASAFSAVTTSDDFVPLAMGGIGAYLSSTPIYGLSDDTIYNDLIDSVERWSTRDHVINRVYINLGNMGILINGKWLATGKVVITDGPKGYRFESIGDNRILNIITATTNRISDDLRLLGSGLYNERKIEYNFTLENLIASLQTNYDDWSIAGTTISILNANDTQAIIDNYTSILNNIKAFEQDIIIPGDVIATTNGITWTGTNFVNSAGEVVDTADIVIPFPEVYENENTRTKDVGWWIDDGTFINTEGNTIVGEPVEPIDPPDIDTGGIIQSIKNIYNWLLGWLTDTLTAIKNAIMLIPTVLTNIYDWLKGALINTLIAIKDGVLSIPGHLVNIYDWVKGITLTGVTTLLDSIKTGINALPNLLTKINNAILGLAGTIVTAFTDVLVGNISNIQVDKLKITGEMFTTKFPFSLPFDINNALGSAFGDINEISNVEIPIKLYKMDTVLVIPQEFNYIANVIKALFLILFDVGLIYALYRLFGGAS